MGTECRWENGVQHLGSFRALARIFHTFSAAICCEAGWRRWPRIPRRAVCTYTVRLGNASAALPANLSLRLATKRHEITELGGFKKVAAGGEDTMAAGVDQMKGKPAANTLSALGLELAGSASPDISYLFCCDLLRGRLAALASHSSSGSTYSYSPDSEMLRPPCQPASRCVSRRKGMKYPG